MVTDAERHRDSARDGRVDLRTPCEPTRRRRRIRGEEGAAIVEFALTLPVLVTLLLGMVSAGLVYNQKLDLTHATREGARYAASIPSTQTFASGTWASNVRDVVVERSYGDLAASQVCVSLVSGSGASMIVIASTSGSACIPNQTYPTTTGDSGVRVQITASRPGNLQLGPLGSRSLTLSSQATAKSESAT